MSPILITIIVILVTLFALAIWMDVKRRRIGDTQSSGAISQATRQTRLRGREKGSESGLGL